MTSRKLDKHFGALKSYILRVGNRERDLQPENFAYREFNEVGQTVDRMNDMIDANQRSQQLFFQNSSHELRTPLMSIQGYAEAIQEGVAADDKEAAAVILDESRKMAELVDDILTLSKMESTQQTLKLESFNLIDLLYDVSWHLKAKADARGISFKHDFEEDYLDIEADEKLIERAITNILSNAVRYAKKKSQFLVEGLLIRSKFVFQMTVTQFQQKTKHTFLNVFIKVKVDILGLVLPLLKKS